MAVPDEHLHAQHYCDPHIGRHTAACGRPVQENLTVYPAEVTCGNCIDYVKLYLQHLLDHAEADVAQLKVWEDE